MTLFQLPASGYQLKALKESTPDVDDDESRMSIYDAVLPPKEEWEKHDINKNSDGIFTGSFMDRKRIGKYSAIGAFIIDLCMYNANHDEKTVLYHSRLANFGLHQYARILEHNGFVKHGSPVKSNSICKYCLTTLENHKRSCKNFTPIYFEILSGTQSSKERMYIVNRLYNSPNNLYGDIISVLFISDVANVGVSLMATHNLVIIPRVSNVSKIDQINARIVRMNSHVSLPPEKRYAKLYLLGVTDAVDKRSNIYKYYKLRDMNNTIVNDFMNTVIPKSIGETLLKKPSQLELTDEERMLTSEMYFDDGSSALMSMGDVILHSMRTNMWRLSSLIHRIKSRELSISYLDLSVFPDSFISYYITNNPNIECFKFTQVMNDTEKVYVRNVTVTDEDSFAHNTLMFKDIVNDYQSAVKGYMQNVEKLPSIHKKRLFFNRLMDVLTVINDFTPLVGWNYLWNDYIYEIRSEYYKDDETQFIKNHSRSHRAKKGACGFYYGNQIVMNDGTSKPIN